MPENELEITLKLDDQATSEAKKRLKEVGDAGDKASEKTKSGFLEARKVVKDFHKEMFIVAAAFGIISAATNEYAQRNKETRDTISELGIAWKNSMAGAGKWFGDAISQHLQFLKDYNDSFDKTGTTLLRSQADLKSFNEELSNQKTLFLNSKMSAEEYYIAVYDGQLNQITINQQAAQSIQQLAQLTQEVSNSELLNARLKTDEQINLLNFYKQEFMTAHQGMSAFTVSVGKSIQTNMSQAFTSMITGAKSAKEAFADLGRAMITAIVDFMVQKVVAWALEKTLLAGTVAASSTAAMTLAAAWAPAALAVNIATMGNAALSAASTSILAAGALTSAMASVGGGGGGKVGTASVGVNGGETSSVSSVIHARAMGGDDIVTRPTLFLAGESGPERATFTPLGYGYSGGGEGIQVNVYGGNFNSRDMIRTLAEEIGFEIDRKLRGARSFA